MRSFRLLAAACVLLGSAPAALAAVPTLDCPLRDARFSIDSPLIDVLLSAPARAVVEAAAPGRLAKAPAFFTATKAPTFSAIISLRAAEPMIRFTPEELAAIDAGLKAVPVTAADRAARCARYDDERPTLATVRDRPNLLIFEKMTGFRDGPSVEAARRALVALAERRGWNVAVTDRGGAIRDDVLRSFDAVIWNNVSGDVLTLRQRAALRRYVEGGGGFVGLHGSNGDPVSFWDWYVDGLIGARFAGHPFPNQFQDAQVVMAPRAGALATGLPAAWTMKDEWYSFRTNPRDKGAMIVATLDEATYQPEGMGRNLRMGDHPIAWTRCIGRGRMFYSAIGHMPAAYAEPHYAQLLGNGIDWAAMARQGKCGSPVR